MIVFIVKSPKTKKRIVYGTSAYNDPFNSGYKGGVKAAYDYRAFGEQVTFTEPTDKVTENFTGKEKDDETELNYFGARYLDPMLGMWISVDAKRQHFSPYTYGSNNPVNRFDPDGMEDVYYLLGGTRSKDYPSVSMSQFKRATSTSASAFNKKGYSVKYATMTKANFNKAVNDPDAKKIYTISHVNSNNGKFGSYNAKEGWLGPNDIKKSSDIDLNSAGCRSQGLVEKVWGDNFKSATGLEADPTWAADGLEDLNRAANVDALLMPENPKNKNE